MTAALLGRTRQPRSFRTACPVGQMRSRSADWGSGASGSRPCACLLTSTSSGMFHGVDERVPVDALRFGVRVLDDFLDRC